MEQLIRYVGDASRYEGTCHCGTSNICKYFSCMSHNRQEVSSPRTNLFSTFEDMASYVNSTLPHPEEVMTDYTSENSALPEQWPLSVIGHNWTFQILQLGLSSEELLSHSGDIGVTQGVFLSRERSDCAVGILPPKPCILSCFFSAAVSTVIRFSVCELFSPGEHFVVILCGGFNLLYYFLKLDRYYTPVICK